MPLSIEGKQKKSQVNGEMANEALRVLATVYRDLSIHEDAGSETDEGDLE